MGKKYSKIIIMVMITMLMVSCVNIYKQGVDYSDFNDKDIPIYDEAIVFEFEGDEQENELVYGIADDIDDIVEFYLEEFEDDDYIIVEEKEEKDEYYLEGYIDNTHFEIEIEDASRDEEEYFDYIVSIKTEIVDEEEIKGMTLYGTWYGMGSNDTTLVITENTFSDGISTRDCIINSDTIIIDGELSRYSIKDDILTLSWGDYSTDYFTRGVTNKAENNNNQLKQDSVNSISIENILNIVFSEEITGRDEIEAFISAWEYETLRSLYHSMDFIYEGQMSLRKIIKKNKNLYLESINDDIFLYTIANSDENNIYLYQLQKGNVNYSYMYNNIEDNDYEDFMDYSYRVDPIVGDTDIIIVSTANSIKIGEYNGEKVLLLSQSSDNDSTKLVCYSYKYRLQLCSKYLSKEGNVLYEMSTNEIKYNTSLLGYDYSFNPPENIEFDVIDESD